MNNIDGLPALNKRLKAISESRGLLKMIQLDAVGEAKRLVPRKTGFLGRSIRPGSLTDDFAIVKATAPYAAFVEFDTKPHIIKPRNKRVLAWAANGSGRRLSGRARTATRRGANGGMRFARVVHHPGTKAQPYLVPGAKAALGRVGVRRIIESWNRAA